MEDPEREWKDAFALFDKTGTGAITAEDLTIVLEQLGASPTPALVQDYIRSVDDNGDGKIQYSEVQEA